jgi:hypothetical protein
LESQEAYLEYVKWKRTHNIFSQKTEGFHVDYESEGVCNPKASLIFEEINFFSATLKKIRSPLFKKKGNSCFKSRKSSVFQKVYLQEIEDGKKN